MSRLISTRSRSAFGFAGVYLKCSSASFTIGPMRPSRGRPRLLHRGDRVLGVLAVTGRRPGPDRSAAPSGAAGTRRARGPLLPQLNPSPGTGGSAATFGWCTAAGSSVVVGVDVVVVGLCVVDAWVRQRSLPVSAVAELSSPFPTTAITVPRDRAAIDDDDRPRRTSVMRRVRARRRSGPTFSARSLVSDGRGVGHHCGCYRTRI